MGSIAVVRPERTVIGESLEISRMISGLWQRAVGHDQNTNMETAVNVMDDAQVDPEGTSGIWKVCH